MKNAKCRIVMFSTRDTQRKIAHKTMLDMSLRFEFSEIILNFFYLSDL